MLVVDASALFEVVAAGPRAELVRTVLIRDGEQFAPELIDAEVGAVAQMHERRRLLDPTAATLVVDAASVWPGRRVAHKPLLARAWALRDNVRFYDALYVSLAEALDADLLTLDARLAGAPGVRCNVIVP